MITPGNLLGIVVDQQERGLPGVMVTLSGGIPPVVQVTDAEGEFRFLDMPPGEHDVKAQLEGFATYTNPSVAIRAGETTRLPITLQPAIID